ncbi:MAG: hypothetical protein ACRYFR_16130 [Janthinobacterium lividum]
MAAKAIINQLKLAYSPLSNRDFTVLRNDPDIQACLKSSSLYAICQRPELQFVNLIYSQAELSVKLEIHQENNPNILLIEFSLKQERLEIDFSKTVLAYVGSHKNNAQLEDFPLSNFSGFRLHESEDGHTLGKFIVWFTPEKLLQNIWNGGIIANVIGKISDFTNYQVHYVGKATDQRVWKRLTGHDTLQDILSLENPIAIDSLPTHEIAILFFAFRDNLHIQRFTNESDESEFADFVLGNNFPEQKTIFLDAEKALINIMMPKYNKELFKNYPKSKDGLYKNSYEQITYSFIDPITLNYELGQIRGGLNAFGGDTIIIENNKHARILKAD